MARVVRALGSGVLAASLVACGTSAPKSHLPRTAHLTPRLARRLDATLREDVRLAGIPGASAAIVFPDGKEWSFATGEADLHTGRRMTPRTSLSFDSVTKVATATLAMRLVEQRRLRLDDPIRRWYREWRGDRDATVRDLLNHTSGLGEPPARFYVGLFRHKRRAVTPAQVLASTPQPGPRTRVPEYSNSGFVLLGIILSRAADEPLTRAMRQEALAAPGGDGLALQPAERPHPPLAHPYFYPHGVSDPVDASDGEPVIPYLALMSAASAAGGLAGDVPSLARWGHALLSGHILKPASLREMTRFRAFDKPWAGYGLGLARSSVDGHTLWGHGGDGLGTHTEFWHLPREDVTIAITWNDDALDSEAPFLAHLARLVLAAR